MASHAQWSVGYCKQADVDFKTFRKIQDASFPNCHRLQFLQMACEKLVKAHLCGKGTDPRDLQASHGYVAKTLPIVLRQTAIDHDFQGPEARRVLTAAKHLCHEINLLAPSVQTRRPTSGQL